jgi:hypothetical protein
MLVESKSVTPAFDHLIGEGWTFGDLMVFSIFWFGERFLIWLPGPPLVLGLYGLFPFCRYISG